METITRRLNLTDVEQYRSIMLEAYEKHPDAFTSSKEERAALPIDWWYARLNPKDDASEIVIGALTGDELVGVVGVTFETRQKIQHKSHLFGMYVKPTMRKSRIGRKLVLAALEEARSHPHVTVMQLTVTDGNQSAQKLYESCGFVTFGIEPYAVTIGQGTYVSKAHMWCDIRNH